VPARAGLRLAEFAFAQFFASGGLLLDAFWKGDEYRNNVRPLRAGSGTYDIAIYPAA